MREAGRVPEMGSAEVAACNGPQNWLPLAHPSVCGAQWGIGVGMEWMVCWRLRAEGDAGLWVLRKWLSLQLQSL